MRAQGKEVTALTHKPILPPGWDWYVETFLMLALQRQKTMDGGVQPLTFTEMAVYAELHGVQKGEETRVFLTFMQAMDRVFLEWVRKQKAKPQKTPGKK